MRFQTWLEEIQALEAERDKELRRIWNDAFVSLKIDARPKADEVRSSLQDITSGSRRQESASTTVMNRLKDIFQRLQGINDPELAKNVQNTMEWLGKESDNHGSTVQPKKTVEELLRKLFGDNKFESFLSNEDRASDMKDDVQAGALKKVEPGTHSPDSTAGMPDQAEIPDQFGAQPDPLSMPGQQPQIPPQNPMMKPTNPMPPKPAGSELGLF